MSAYGVYECAAPKCSQKWHKLGEGKLFTFHVKGIGSEERRVRHVWFCGQCFESWEATTYKDEVVLVPLYQRVG